MARLRTLRVTHTTADVEDAGTDEKVSLHLPRGGKQDSVSGHVLKFPNLPHDERERGRTDEYEFDISNLNLGTEDLGPLNSGAIKIQIHGSEAWVPKTFRVVGETVTGERVLLVDIPQWPRDRTFSTDTKEGRAIWALRL